MVGWWIRRDKKEVQLEGLGNLPRDEWILSASWLKVGVRATFPLPSCLQKPISIKQDGSRANFPSSVKRVCNFIAVFPLLADARHPGLGDNPFIRMVRSILDRTNTLSNNRK